MPYYETIMAGSWRYGTSSSSSSSSDSSDSDSDEESSRVTRRRLSEAVSRLLASRRGPEVSPPSALEARLPGHRLGNTCWCTCGHCARMSVISESVCCKEVRDIVRKKTDEYPCITLHPGFEPVCLNIHSIEVSYYWYMEKMPVYLDKLAIHEQYRRIAYGRFARWIWHSMGQSMHKVVPSCVTTLIRTSMPNETVANFTYPRY
ncbi:uncharacterized protein LOC135383847 [Ornithodoros turicata]|uniref:uncharacterized protein LOC135383847 n=1 Tax=Ornithodoros turicata TaxID=34597 RepID=UPI00313A3C8A